MPQVGPATEIKSYTASINAMKTLQGLLLTAEA